MRQEDEQVRLLLRTRVIRLNELVTGIAVGLCAGLVLFCATNFLVLKGGDVVGPHLALLGQVFIGYRVTFVGSFIGFFYALISFGLIGYCGAKIYNWIAAINLRRQNQNKRVE